MEKRGWGVRGGGGEATKRMTLTTMIWQTNYLSYFNVTKWENIEKYVSMNNKKQ